MKFIRCSLFAFVLGMVSIPFGRLLAKINFNIDNFLFRERDFEKQFFNTIKIKKWKDKLPDMSKVVSRIPRKQINADGNICQLEVLIRETCVAELDHVILCMLGIFFIYLWPGAVGMFLCCMYIAINIPFILIQRYNRPRFVKLLYRNLNKAY